MHMRRMKVRTKALMHKHLQIWREMCSSKENFNNKGMAVILDQTPKKKRFK
eukprot:c7817_g1_i1 orf=55-207(-)